MEQQLEKLTQAILARGELIKQLQVQCEAIQASVGEMKPIRLDVKTETKPAAPVVADPLLRAEVPHSSTTDQHFGLSSRRDEATSRVDLKADLQRRVSPIRDSHSMTTPAQVSSLRSFSTGELDALMPTGCSMNCSNDDIASQKSAFMPDAALGSPLTAALLDVAITSPEPTVATLLVRDGTSDLAAHQLPDEMLRAPPVTVMLDFGSVVTKTNGDIALDSYMTTMMEMDKRQPWPPPSKRRPRERVLSHGRHHGRCSSAMKVVYS